MTVVRGVDSPFDASGIVRDATDVAHYTGRPASLVHALRATVDRVPDAEAVVEVGGPSSTYAELWDAAAVVAGGLRESGVRRGDRVALRLGSGRDWCVAFYATQLAGAVAVPVNTALTETEAGFIVADSGARLTLEPGSALPAGRPCAVDDLAPDDLAAIFYTSGTTGSPKGAMTSHRSFLANTETVRRIVGFGDDARGVRNLAAAPLFSVTSCNSQLLPMCELGGTTVVLPAFTPAGFVEAIATYRATLLIASPGMYRLALPGLAAAGVGSVGSVGSVDRVTYGAAPASPQLLDQLSEVFPGAAVESAFGLTEVASVATYLPDRFLREHPGSVGYAAPVVDLDLADLADGVGELLIRGSNVVDGYWNRPEETAATFVDGWLRTGDLARIDEHGLTWIVDRKKDMILRGGENVYSVEVENALAQHPDVLEVAVVGVADEVLGERVGAVIVARGGVSVNPREVVDAARDRLAAYKLPQWVCLRDQPLPRNPGGKILKASLRSATTWQRLAR